MGGNLHPRLDNGERSIANKYREGKLKSTSKGELKYLKSLRGKRLSVTQCIGDFSLRYLTVLLYVMTRRRFGCDRALNVTEYKLLMQCQEWHVQTTRLETRTKELNESASVRVPNPDA